MENHCPITLISPFLPYRFPKNVLFSLVKWRQGRKVEISLYIIIDRSTDPLIDQLTDDQLTE